MEARAIVDVLDSLKSILDRAPG